MGIMVCFFLWAMQDLYHQPSYGPHGPQSQQSPRPICSQVQSVVLMVPDVGQSRTTRVLCDTHVYTGRVLQRDARTR